MQNLRICRGMPKQRYVNNTLIFSSSGYEYSCACFNFTSGQLEGVKRKKLQLLVLGRDHDSLSLPLKAVNEEKTNFNFLNLGGHFWNTERQLLNSKTRPWSAVCERLSVVQFQARIWLWNRSFPKGLVNMSGLRSEIELMWLTRLRKKWLFAIWYFKELRIGGVNKANIGYSQMTISILIEYLKSPHSSDHKHMLLAALPSYSIEDPSPHYACS